MGASWRWRGHASIQGSTDIPTLYDILPGYLPMPHAHAHQNLGTYVDRNAPRTGYWGNTRAYIVSLMKAWFADAATEENDYCFDHLPCVTGDHSIYPAIMGMVDGWCKGFFVMGQNPAVGAANGKLQRLALANLDWLMVRDLLETETASFWYDSPEIETGELKPEEIDTEVFFLPAASHVEKSGTFTNTQRLLQWRRKAVEPKDDCRSELWFMYHLGRRVKEKLGNSGERKDKPVQDLNWDYLTEMENGIEEPSAEAVLREINGYNHNNDVLSSYPELKDDGTTSCGAWIYSGVYADEVNQADRRRPWTEQTYVAPEWGWAWPMNRRILYNRASADPEGKPWSERKKYVWWDEGQEKWVGHDIPDFELTKRPDYVPEEGARAEDAIRGDKPFIMQADGTGWLYVPAGLTDGPLPTHYEPEESPFDNPLYGQRSNPARQRFPRADNPYNPSDGHPGNRVFPHVLTTYRLTEHHTAGGMSRSTERLSGLMPEMFCEVSPELAELVGLENGERQPRMSFFTDTTVCIGCKACQVACKEWNGVPDPIGKLTGYSYDNTGELDANNWRHVAFIEQRKPVYLQENAHLGTPAIEGEPDFRWLMSSDVCKHCTTAPCVDVCPTGSLFYTEFGTVVVQEDICNGCGYCVPVCPFGVLDRREDDGQVWKCTMCYNRQKDGLEPACAQACPTDSIHTVLSMSCARRPTVAWRWSSRLGPPTPTSTARTRTAMAWARSSSSSMSRRSTACRPTSEGVTRKYGSLWGSAAVAAGALVAGVAAAFVGSSR